MRTTIRLPDALYDEVKELAHAQDVTVTSVIERALRAEIARRSESPAAEFVVRPYRPDVPGTLPGVDLNNSAALLDVMEGIR